MNFSQQKPGFLIDTSSLQHMFLQPKPLLSVRGDQEMSLKLGGREIEARSDSGVNFYLKMGLQTYYLMLSI
jgi:hypothetical protein